MKFRIGTLLFVLLISLVAVPAFAATFDANGRWHIETAPGQSLFGLDIPSVWLKADIVQYDNDTFTMATDPIVTLDNIVYSGGGTILGNQYDFNPILKEYFNTAAVFPGSGMNLDLELSLASFDLSSDNELAGSFSIKGFEYEIEFIGTKEAVPVPAAVWLLGSGMVALVGVKRRAKA